MDVCFNKFKKGVDIKAILDISLIEDIKPGMLPGYFFPKLIKMGHLKIDPYYPDQQGNICYYLHFNNVSRRLKRRGCRIDLNSEESVEAAYKKAKTAEFLTIKPGESIIAQTYEKLGLSNWLAAKMENTTTLGRIFLNHASHGYMHPGHGYKEPAQLMIELTNLGKRTAVLQPAVEEGGQIYGSQAFRFYIEKLPYPAVPYTHGSKNARLKMNESDKS